MPCVFARPFVFFFDTCGQAGQTLG